jgi:hypothetical protein
MQRVHTFVLFLLPPEVAMRTIFKFGNQRLLVLLCAWETLFPTIGPFPHISHTFAIGFSFYPIPRKFHFPSFITDKMDQCMICVLVSNCPEFDFLPSFITLGKVFSTSHLRLSRFSFILLL